MILIDTNVVWELMRPNPAPAVLAWFGRQDATALHLSAVGEAELRRGAAILPDGRRRDRLTGLRIRYGQEEILCRTGGWSIFR